MSEEVSVRVDDESLRPARGVVFAGNEHTGIGKPGQFETFLGEEGFGIFRNSVVAHHHHLKLSIFELAVDFVQIRYLLFAGNAPARPEVKEYQLSAIVLQLDGL